MGPYFNCAEKYKKSLNALSQRTEFISDSEESHVYMFKYTKLITNIRKIYESSLRRNIGRSLFANSLEKRYI